MILVALGTQDKPFNRLIKSIDKLVKDKVITDEVIMQLGYTKYVGQINHFDFVPEKELNKLMKKSNLIICHAGVGTIFNALNYKKPIIVVPRLKKYGEHLNDHQLQIASEFEKLGLIKVCLDLKKLPDIIKEANNYIPKKMNLNTKDLCNSIESFIEEVE